MTKNKKGYIIYTFVLVVVALMLSSRTVIASISAYFSVRESVKSYSDIQAMKTISDLAVSQFALEFSTKSASYNTSDSDVPLVGNMLYTSTINKIVEEMCDSGEDGTIYWKSKDVNTIINGLDINEQEMKLSLLSSIEGRDNFFRAYLNAIPELDWTNPNATASDTSISVPFKPIEIEIELDVGIESIRKRYIIEGIIFNALSITDALGNTYTTMTLSGEVKINYR